jgi:hypothetical protein
VNVAALFLLVATLAAGCGGGQAHGVLSDTAGNLGGSTTAT